MSFTVKIPYVTETEDPRWAWPAPIVCEHMRVPHPRRRRVARLILTRVSRWILGVPLAGSTAG